MKEQRIVRCLADVVYLLLLIFHVPGHVFRSRLGLVEMSIDCETNTPQLKYGDAVDLLGPQRGADETYMRILKLTIETRDLCVTHKIVATQIRPICFGPGDRHLLREQDRLHHVVRRQRRVHPWHPGQLLVPPWPREKDTRKM